MFEIGFLAGGNGVAIKHSDRQKNRMRAKKRCGNKKRNDFTFIVSAFLSAGEEGSRNLGNYSKATCINCRILGILSFLPPI